MSPSHAYVFHLTHTLSSKKKPHLTILILNLTDAINVYQEAKAKTQLFERMLYFPVTAMRLEPTTT